MRIKNIILELVEKLDLDLKGLVVTTEVASGDYVYLPLIAALAGADKVYALGRDTSYGKYIEHKARLSDISRAFGVSSIIEPCETSSFNSWVESDIITNSGMVRPIDRAKLQQLKLTAVIPLMWETWEFRSNEIDINACQEFGIPVIGTEEKFGAIDMYEYPGMLALRMLFDVQCDFSSDKIALIGGGLTGTLIAKTLSRFNDSFLWFTDQPLDKEFKRNSIPLRSLDSLIKEDYLDVIFVAEHSVNNPLIGNGAPITFEKIGEKFPDVKVVHLCGNIDKENLVNSKLSFYPQNIAPFGHMSVFPSVMSVKPTLKLFSGGLKVGEIASKIRKRGGSIEEAIQATIDYGIGQDFPGGFMSYGRD